MIIRELGPDEISYLLELWQICLLPTKPKGRDHPDRIREEMKGSSNQFLVAVEEEMIVGSILITHDGRKGWINRLSVHPDHRNEGTGRALVYEAEKWFKDQGIGIFACLIEGENTGSMDVLEKLGYKEFPGVKYYTKRTKPDI